ncbi:MAG TPA: acyclic terpene utilization AtuA family protein, partial [Thermoanaerobaculia bacterium]|nr:acyclic terpene utilization AtuA family protein [Thermoanaerobaculia bacterium]
PLVHEVRWHWDDWDRLAAGTVAGHVLECGAQTTGGNLTDWRGVKGLAAAGYPIAEVSEDGTFFITKHPGTGGVVSRATVVEQLLYEIGDPAAYATPDVTVDFTSFSVEEEAGDRVRIAGVRGAPPPPTLKAGVTWSAGWKAVGTFLFGPPDGEEKAKALAAIVWERVGPGFEETATEILGGREVFLRLGVRDADRKKVDAFSRRFASFALSGPPGVTIPGGGRPPVQEVFGFWPAAVPRSAVAPALHVGGETIPISTEAPATRALPDPPPAAREASAPADGGRAVPLAALAFARSGDKGDAANIGVAARDARAFAILRERLTTDFVRHVFRAETRGRVVRYELPNLRAFNFVLERSLGGGGVISLRTDPQGKTFAQRLLAEQVSGPEAEGREP